MKDTKKATLTAANDSELLAKLAELDKTIDSEAGLVRAGAIQARKRVSAEIDKRGGEVKLIRSTTEDAAAIADGQAEADCTDPEGHADQIEAIGECGTCNYATAAALAEAAEKEGAVLAELDAIKAAGDKVTGARTTDEDDEYQQTEPKPAHELRPVSVNDVVFGGSPEEGEVELLAEKMDLPVDDERLTTMTTVLEGVEVIAWQKAVKIAGQKTKGGAPKTVQVEKGEYIIAGGAYAAVHFPGTPATSRWVLAELVDLGEHKSLVAVPFKVAKTWDDVVALLALVTA